jgi:hypothetical protein
MILNHLLELKNVVSHYNAGKSDVLFTFYFKKYDEKITYDINT